MRRFTEKYRQNSGGALIGRPSCRCSSKLCSRSARSAGNAAHHRAAQVISGGNVPKSAPGNASGSFAIGPSASYTTCTHPRPNTHTPNQAGMSTRAIDVDPAVSVEAAVQVSTRDVSREHATPQCRDQHDQTEPTEDQDQPRKRIRCGSGGGGVVFAGEPRDHEPSARANATRLLHHRWTTLEPHVLNFSTLAPSRGCRETS